MSAPSPDLDRLEAACQAIWSRAQAVDELAELPVDDLGELDRAGLLAAVLPGRVFVTDPDQLGRVLRAIGGASLTVGRLYEGHANAARLIDHYGGDQARAILAAEVQAGRISGVWNAERSDGPRIVPTDGGWRLSGRKIHCSGAGHIRRPIVTARDPQDRRWMLLPDLAAPGVTIDVSVWRAAGMRGTATATVCFEALFVPVAAVVGDADDYYRSPLFSGGAWRVLTVQLGGLDRILALHAERLLTSGRHDDPVFRARFATAAAAVECARLLVAEAGRRAEGANGDPTAIDAYVDQARGQFELLALGAIDATRRNIGLSSFIAPDPLDRCLRDLETYLRQPFVDASRDSAARWLLAHGGRFA
jgi:alkylation response protein AidB-like acyl-CoA dehydrogenase